MEVCVPYNNQNYWESSSSDYQNVISEEDEMPMTHVTSKVYERSRIKALADERETVQKKTFTKWINSSLFQRGMRVDDLYIDLRDGKVLLALVEVLSNEMVPKPTRGRMRIHCLENVDKCLGFLYDQKVHLENVGAHDIVDGNARLTLGLIWTMILRFQIQDICIDELDSTDAKCAKDALLLWCQMKTAGYPSVNIRNFTTSWRNGLGFVALIHKHRPDIISFTGCNRGENINNLTLAFNVAENSLGLAALLDPEDVDVEMPDERSIITYLASYYHYFNAIKANIVSNKRLNKLLNQALEDQQMQDLYQSLVTKLLEWIEHTIKLLKMRQFANSISGVQHQMNTFNLYRINEKPPKFVEKGELEVLLFTIKSNMIASRRRVYTPPESFSLATINNAWDELNKAEHNREMALRKELIRQENLKNLAQKFLRKATLRESWISDNLELLSKQSLGNNLSSVMAALKKHEAIETDIYAYEENLICLTKLSENLEEEMYNDVELIMNVKDKIFDLWKNLLKTIHDRREYLDNHLCVFNLINEFTELQLTIADLASRLKSGDFGKHLMGVEELLRSHELIEANLRVVNQHLEKLVSEADRYVRYSDKDFHNNSKNKDMILEARYATIEDYHDLMDLAEERKQGLQHSHLVWQYVVDISSEEQWIKEMLEIMKNPDLGFDLSSVDRCLRKHKAMEEELSKRRQLLESKLVEGKNLAENSRVGEEIIMVENEKIQKLWEILIDATEGRKQRLMEMFDFYQFVSDCDDLNSWINEFRRFFDMTLLGDKMSHTELLIKNNQQNMQVIENQKVHLIQLGVQSQSLMNYENIDKTVVSKKMEAVERNYMDLLELAHRLQEKLLDALTVYRLLNDADSVRSWIVEKEKFLVNFIPSDDIEELEMLKHRFEIFETDLTKQAEKVYHVNTLSENLVINGNPNYKVIIDNQDNLNNVWNNMADLIDSKREDLLAKYHYNNFNTDCQQTIEWIKEKIQLVESTDEMKDDIDGLLQMQRRISHLQRDICAIEAKIDHLDTQGALIIRSKLRNQKEIEEQLDLVHYNWDMLNKMLKDRDSRLADKNDIHHFLCNLDQFQLWLSQMQTEMATQIIPESLKEIEKMIYEFNGMRDEITKMEPQLRETMGIGKDLTKSVGETNSDQRNRLNQRLAGLESGWQTLIDLTDEKDKRLEEYLKSMVFFDDAKHIEKILSLQETFLTKEIQSNLFDTRGSKSNLLALHEIVNETDTFIQRMESDSKLLQSVLEQGKNLIKENSPYKDKVEYKCHLLEERWKKNLQSAKLRKENLREQLMLHELLQDIDDVDDNLIEKIHTLSDIVTCNTGAIKSSLSQVKALEEELNVYRPRVAELNEAGRQMGKTYPKYKGELDNHLDNLNGTLSELTKALEEKLLKLTHVNRETVFVESTTDMMNWLESLESQVIADDEPSDKRTGLTSLNDQLKKLNSKNDELENKRKMIEDMRDHSDKLKEQFPERASHYEEIEQKVKVTLTSLAAPLSDRLSAVNLKKQGEEHLRNCDEEIDWIKEKIEVLRSRNKQLESICSLQECQQLGSRHKSVKIEVENRRPRIESLIEEARAMMREGHPNKEHISESVSELSSAWKDLYEEIRNFETSLGNKLRIQEYLLDVSEACSWMSEKELDLVNIRISKRDDQQLRRLTRKHKTLEMEIADYLSNIQELDRRCKTLSSDYSGVQLDLMKNYDVLNSICWEKKNEILLFLHYCDTFELFQNIEAWIIEKTKVARNDDAGRDLDQCTLLRDRFALFASETNKVGIVKINDANKQFDELIVGKHPFAHSVSMWKDRINEIWADLLELIDTRIQLLKSAWDLHRWYCDCQFLLEGIAEKKASILTLNELGRDPKSIGILQRTLKIFEKDLSRIDSEISAALAVSDNLLPLYSKDKEAMLIIKRNELVLALQSLRKILEDRKLNNLESADFHNFMAMVRQLISWIEDISTQMEMKHKPRDVSGIELLLANHRNLKTEMDSKEENFSICMNLGGTLVRTKHAKSAEIRSKCNEICDKRDALFKKWFGILDHLLLLVEVYQWARDAATAESWLVAQETYLLNEDLGQSLDETLAILKKFLLFEKTYQSQTEKFEQIKKLTTLEIRAKQLSSPQQRPLKKSEVRTEHLAMEDVEDLPSERIEAAKTTEVAAASSFIPEKSQSFVRRCNSIDSCLDQESDRKPAAFSSVRPSQPRPISQQPSQSTVSVPKATSGAGGSRPMPSNLSKSQNVIGSSQGSGDGGEGGPRSSRPEDVVIKGALYRKHQWAIQGMKAANRSWHSMFVQVANSRMTFFKDERHYRDNPGQFYKHEMPIVLRDVVAAPAQDYGKRPCVFRLRHRNGGEYLFQAGSVVDMTRWVDAINAATTQSVRATVAKGATAPLTTTQSHPNLSSASKPPPPEKGLKRFFSSIRLKK